MLLAATRPAFLSVTAVAVLLGLATAYYDLGRIDTWTAIATLCFALVAHAGINVINDYYDCLNGTDQANVDRLFPFTGGSRFIQNGVLSAAQTRTFGYALLAAVVPAGLALTAASGAGLLLIGATGMLIGWAYSATPLKLNSRGLGELCVTAGFLCVVVGADFVQRKAFVATPFSAGIPYALLVTNVLYINQFPDRSADLAAGKLHWVARLSPRIARWGYVIVLAGYAWLLVTAVAVRGCLPAAALAGLGALVPGGFAAVQLFRHSDDPARLAPGIQATIAAALAGGLLLSAALAASR